MGWKYQKKRHSNAKKYGVAGGLYAKPKKRFKSPIITAPLSSKATKLPIQFSINVPSTNYDKKISVEAFRKRAENTAKELSNKFGGDTAIKGKGDYTSDGKLIREDVVIIESSMTTADYEKKKSEIENFIKEKKKEWNQESIGYSFEDDFYIYPKFD
ncbi:hypothetical protein JW865_04640 [Candidatus Bathyarchaeota archaeon]|nr:hypothetical protein [Candidatus Bathyarchaeota archaeon]